MVKDFTLKYVKMKHIGIDIKEEYNGLKPCMIDSIIMNNDKMHSDLVYTCNVSVEIVNGGGIFKWVQAEKIIVEVEGVFEFDKVIRMEKYMENKNAYDRLIKDKVLTMLHEYKNPLRKLIKDIYDLSSYSLKFI